jgi:hypothetical protein
MLGKIMIALTAAAVVTVVPTMSASAQQKSTQQKKVTVNIPKQVRDANRGNSELGAANRASVRTSWWTSGPSHDQTALAKKK